MRPKLEVVKGEPKEKPSYVKVAGHLFLNTKTGVYYVRKTFRRYRIPDLFQSTLQTKLSKAKAKADQMIADHMNHYLGGSGNLLEKRKGMAISKVIDEIQDTVTPLKRKGTQENHKLYLGELKKEWGSWDISRISLPAWNNWLNEFRRRKNRKTFSDYVKHMNLVLRYAYKQRYVTHLVTLPNPDPVGEGAGRVFKRDEIERLWDAMNEETRDQFVLSFECFMRLREALYLEWARVDLSTGVITLRAQDVKTGSKTGKGRAFRMSDHALKRLVARRKRIKDSRYVFPSPENKEKPIHSNKKAWLTAKRKAGIKGRARWHDLRHTAITWALLDSKVDPVLVSEYAGVSLRTIQRVYLHSTHEKTAQVSGAVKIFAPKGVDSV